MHLASVKWILCLYRLHVWSENLIDADVYHGLIFVIDLREPRALFIRVIEIFILLYGRYESTVVSII